MDLNTAIEILKNRTDGFPWYWLSYGEKCYAFAVVEAFPIIIGEQYPTPGSRLYPDMNDPAIWIGENGVKIYIHEWICTVERQNGDIICQFIAMAHAELLKDLVIEEDRENDKHN